MFNNKKVGLTCKVFVSGAVLTEDYAMDVGADMYVKYSKRTVVKVKTMFSN
ncbi:MAG: hypothetical protein GYA87_02260 [Christensenellaceae bacterium]|nr:hypothetical protein [Christensenellaceae bacterium]